MAEKQQFFSSRPVIPQPIKPKAICTIPEQYLTRSVKPAIHSAFTTFLSTLFPSETVVSLTELYKLGITKSADVIFFQIDAKGNVRTGKVMKYDPVTGHRIKDESVKNRITWIHSLLKQKGLLPQQWEQTQCLFGEHLLPQYPDKTVAFVESEKTAVICTAYMPQYLWLATGGKSQLNPEKLSPLHNRKVIAFPDVDAFAECNTKLKAIHTLDITVSDFLQKRATSEETAAQIDIADWLMAHKDDTLTEEPAPEPTPNPAFLSVAKFFTPEHHENLRELIEKLDLVPMNIAHISNNI